MNELSEAQKAFLELIDRSARADGWASVSDALLPYVTRMASEIPSLVEVDLAANRVRITDAHLDRICWTL